MSHLRAALRTVALALVTAALYGIQLVARLGLALVGRPSWRVRTRLFRLWSRSVAALLSMKIDVEGRPPQPPFLLVSNHLGYMDVIALASQVECVFVSRADVSRWPLFGHLCRVADTIFVDRASKRDVGPVLDRIGDVLDQGRGVVLFPEGTSSDGATVGRFKSSLLEAAARRGLPVSYAALSYETPPRSAPARLAVCWWGDMTFVKHLLGLFGLPGFRARIAFGRQPIREVDRKVLAARLSQAVLSRLHRIAS